MPKLVVSQQGGAAEYQLGPQPITIGREPENDIQVDWPDVSRRHCRVEPLPQGGYRLLDLGSKNGTFLNGRQITAMALEFEDRVRVGEALLVYVADDVPAAKALESGQDDPFPTFPPIRKPDPGDATEEPTEKDGTWRRSSRPVEAQARGPHTRASNRTYLKERLVRLGLLSQNIASELDLTRLMDTILDEVLDFTGFERGLLLLAEEEGGRLQPVLGRNMDHEHLDDEERRFSRGLVEESLLNRKITFRNGIRAGEGSFSARDSVVSMGLDSALCIPLNVPLRMTGRPATEERRRTKKRRRILGAIYLDSTFPIRRLDDADLRLLEAVAAQAAIALQNARLHYQATIDPLTSLYNRGFITQAFEDELRYARDHGDHMGVMILDLDHFKQINDTYGHGVGDEVLKRVARRLRRATRRDDYAGRWGGEEFVVILPGEGLEGTLVVAEKVASVIRDQPMGQAEVNVTASIGVSVYPEHGDTTALLIKRADQALYAAKDAGRNRTVVFAPELDHPDHRTDPMGGMLLSNPAHTHRNLTAIFDTIDVLSTRQPPQQVLARTLDNVCDLTRARRALLIAQNPEGEQKAVGARARGGKPLPDEFLEEYSHSAVRTALAENRSLCMLDAGDEEALKLHSSSIDKLGLNTVMVVPLTVNEQIVGALYADDTIAKREFGHMDLSHLEVIAHQLSLSLAANRDLFDLVCGADTPRRDPETLRLQAEVERLRAELDNLKQQDG
jgi:diguanylate cyclase (GGDEF)-like protein